MTWHSAVIPQSSTITLDMMLLVHNWLVDEGYQYIKELSYSTRRTRVYFSSAAFNGKADYYLAMSRANDFAGGYSDNSTMLQFAVAEGFDPATNLFTKRAFGYPKTNVDIDGTGIDAGYQHQQLLWSYFVIGAVSGGVGAASEYWLSITPKRVAGSARGGLINQSSMTYPWFYAGLFEDATMSGLPAIGIVGPYSNYVTRNVGAKRDYGFQLGEPGVWTKASSALNLYTSQYVVSPVYMPGFNIDAAFPRVWLPDCIIAQPSGALLGDSMTVDGDLYRMVNQPGYIWLRAV